ncbi:winged helix-turn-helix transcriptional regulator [Cytobacillus firmus]|nr:winged helix-turn-helix transcriptional regulator [Cytobacillus firmus]
MLTVEIHNGRQNEIHIYDGNKLFRQILLVPGQQYMVNSPVRQRNKKNGRIVTFQDLITTSDKTVAKVLYVDTKRPGKVNIEDLDHLHLPAEQLATKKTIKLSGEPRKEELYEEFLPSFQLYIDMLNLIDKRKNENNIAVISQKTIAEHLSISPSNVSKRIKQLVRYGAIEQLQAGIYKLINCSIWYTPYRVVHSLIRLLNEQPEVNSSYKKQATILNVSIQDIFQAWAYIESLKMNK